MAQKRAVKKSGRKTKPRSRNPLAATGKAKPTRKAVGAKKKSARKAVVKSATRKAARKSKPKKAARVTETARKPSAARSRAAVARKAAAPLPKKMTAQKKRAARPAMKPVSEVGVRERQTTAPAMPAGADAAPSGNPLPSGNEGAVAEGGETAAS